MFNERWASELEVRVTTLERDIRELRHEVGDSILKPLLREMTELKSLVRNRPTEDSGEDRHLTMRDFWIAMASVGATVAVLKALHLLG